MKIIAVLLLCLAASAEAGESKAFYASLVPSDTVAVLSATNPAAFIEAASKAGLGGLMVPEGTGSGLMQSVLQRVELIGALAAGLPKEQSEALLKGGFAVALLPQADENDKHLPVLVLIDLSGITADSRAMLEKSLVPSIELLLRAKPEALGDGVYGLRLGERDFAFAFRRNALVAGFKSEVAALGKAPALSGNPLFAKVQAGIGSGPGIAGYVNVLALLEELDRRMPDVERRESLRRLKIDSFPAFGFRTGIEADGQISDSLFLATSKLRNSWLHTLPATSRSLKAAQFAPASYDLMISADVGPGEIMWDALRAAVEELWGAGGIEDFDNRNEGFAGPFGVDVRNDILASVDGEIFVAADLDKLGESLAGGGGMMPLLVGFHMKQQDVLEAALSRVLESDVVWGELGVDRKLEKRGKYTLVMITSPFEAGLYYGYAFIDGYFLISLDFQVLENAVKAVQTGQSLASDPAFVRVKKAMPENSSFECFARTSVLCRELAKAYGPYVDPALAPAVRTIAGAAGKLDASMASVVAGDDGLSGSVRSPMGLAAAIASASVLQDASVRMEVDQVHKSFSTVSKALEQYRQAAKAYPTSLDELVPDLLADVPVDPFAPAGMPIRYRSAMRTVAGAVQSVYILASDGPDGKRDVEVDRIDLFEWQQKPDSKDPAELKALIYQFRKEEFEDETGLRDEGDIVESGPANGQKEGAK